MTIEQAHHRQRLPNDRPAIVHRFNIAGHEGYLHVGLYPNGQPGEIFIKMSKTGSTISGLMDGIGILTSIALQHGVPLGVLVDKMRHTRFEPAGICENTTLSPASSILDYIFRYLELRFLAADVHEVVSDSLRHSDIVTIVDPRIDHS